jgi:Uma2 family endonuclease
MATKTALTWEEFLAAGKEGQFWEYVDGEVKFMSPHMGGGQPETRRSDVGRRRDGRD